MCALQIDLLLFAGGGESSVNSLMQAFNEFSKVSGLNANQLKSCVYFEGLM